MDVEHAAVSVVYSVRFTPAQKPIMNIPLRHGDLRDACRAARARGARARGRANWKLHRGVRRVFARAGSADMPVEMHFKFNSDLRSDPYSTCV
eukprot:COSAG02_NODE_8920_length_2400_cov_1.365928_1_plen_93_part_00